MTIQETIKQLNILLSREQNLLGCSSDEQQRSQMIEALEVAKQAVEKSDVKHGKWFKSKNQRICSECGYFYFSNNVNTNYCCSCGAKMDKE